MKTFHGNAFEILHQEYFNLLLDENSAFTVMLFETSILEINRTFKEPI
jgi:hypothetical protein